MASSRRLARTALGGVVALFIGLVVRPAPAVDWAITPRGSLLLNAGMVSEICELSGITYLGPVGGGLERFAAVQDDGNQFVLLDVDLAADAVIQSATAASGIGASPGFDFEGIAYRESHGTAFISEESTPGIREYSLTTGGLLGSVVVPIVFSTQRFNRGLESLARSLDGAAMWTANEGALTVDGPDATAADGTTVRLLRLDDNGVSVTAGSQFAYAVDPVHADNPVQSGLVDLVMLPDNTLLALERSRASAVPAFESRIYHIDFGGATDISVAPYNTGLVGQSFTPVSKTLLWSGQAGTASGENLEGLALGPQLDSGNWALVGVVDNGGIGGNRIVSFELTPVPTCTLAGDFDCSGAVGEEDFDLWRASFGLVGEQQADGNNDGLVNGADYTVWRDNLGATLPVSTTTHDSNATVPVPEPNASLGLWIGGLMMRRSILANRGPRAGATLCAKHVGLRPSSSQPLG